MIYVGIKTKDINNLLKSFMVAIGITLYYIMDKIL